MPITEGGKFSPVDRIVSPGVFTRENDLSGVAQGVAEIGAVILAPFPKGPGFAPTLITNTADLEEKFGLADGVYYGPYTAKEYPDEHVIDDVDPLKYEEVNENSPCPAGPAGDGIQTVS